MFADDGKTFIDADKFPVTARRSIKLFNQVAHQSNPAFVFGWRVDRRNESGSVPVRTDVAPSATRCCAFIQLLEERRITHSLALLLGIVASVAKALIAVGIALLRPVFAEFRRVPAAVEEAPKPPLL